MVVAPGARRSKGFERRILFQLSHRAPQVIHEKSSKIAADTKPHQDALNQHILAIPRHGIRWNLPPFDAELIGKIVEVEPRVFAIRQSPRTAGNPAVAVVDQIKDLDLSDLIAKPARHVSAASSDLCVSFPTQAHEIVVLCDHLTRRPREVQREDPHVAAQVFHIGNKFFREISGFTPHDPTTTERRQPELVTGSVDRFHPRNTEISDYFWMNERSNEASARGVDV